MSTGHAKHDSMEGINEPKKTHSKHKSMDTKHEENISWEEMLREGLFLFLFLFLFFFT